MIRRDSRTPRPEKTANCAAPSRGKPSRRKSAGFGIRGSGTADSFRKVSEKLPKVLISRKTVTFQIFDLYI